MTAECDHETNLVALQAGRDDTRPGVMIKALVVLAIEMIFRDQGIAMEERSAKVHWSTPPNIAPGR